jgi:hypothetical protein
LRFTCNATQKKKHLASVAPGVFLMVGGSGIISNQKSGNLPENSRNNKKSETAPSTACSAETCRELLDTLAQWNTYLEDHVPYFQSQPQEPTP